MNDENLISLADRTTDKQREIASLGGKASVESRRKKRMWKDTLNIMLSTKANDNNREILKNYGIEEGTIGDAILYGGIVQKAIKGDRWAIEQLAKITGNYDAEKVDIKMPVQIKVEDDYGD